MKVLNLNFCESLTQIPNLSGLPNLEEVSFEGCSKLITIDCSVGLLAKLKRLNACDCSQLRSFPPLKLPSLEGLNLYGCSSLESFPEILEKMENIESLDLCTTNISKFPDSFGNLTRLGCMCVSHLLPSRSLDTMPQLASLVISQRRRVPTFLNEKESFMLLPSKLEYLTLYQCDVLSDEYLVLVPSLFPNLKELHIMECPSITVVPECIKECRFLRKLTLFGCQQLREICEGILPRLTYLSVKECPSLSSSCRSMLLRQELGADVEIDLELRNLEGETIPERFEHQNRGRSPSLSFWFRNKFPLNDYSFWFRNDFPLILVCIASPPSPNMPDDDYSFRVNSFINGSTGQEFGVNWGYTLLMRLSQPNYSLEYKFIENGWNHVEVTTHSGLDCGIGIHVLKGQNMQDIRFTNPDKRRNIDLNLAPLEEDDVNTELTL